MVIMGPPLTLISIVKPKQGVGSHVGSHRVPPNPIWVPRREELGPTGSHQVRIGTNARLVVLRARFWVQKMRMLPAST